MTGSSNIVFLFSSLLFPFLCLFLMHHSPCSLSLWRRKKKERIRFGLIFCFWIRHVFHLFCVVLAIPSFPFLSLIPYLSLHQEERKRSWSVCMDVYVSADIYLVWFLFCLSFRCWIIALSLSISFVSPSSFRRDDVDVKIRASQKDSDS